MSRGRRIARRTFLAVTASAAGGFVLGWSVYKWPVRNPLLDGLADGEAALTPYVRIDPDGITIITPRADVGQGAHSIQAALVAEELDLEWGTFAIDAGPPSKAYANRVTADELVPAAMLDDGPVANALRSLGTVYTTATGVQITGGSTTVREGFDKLRAAGAAARQMLLTAAATRTGLPVAALQTERGAVLTPTGERIPYTALAAEAASVPVPHDPPLRDPRDWRILGRPMQRLDTVAKSTGRLTYGIDVRLPGMRFATARVNPRRGGGVRRVELSAARGARGVVDVVAVHDGFAVIADNTWRAFRAAAAIDVDWGAARHVGSTEAMAEVVAAAFTGRRDSRFRNDGNVDRALAAGDVRRVDAEYRLPHLAHAPLEPISTTVQFDGTHLEIWTATQIPRFAVTFAARAAGVSSDRVTLHVLPAGGSFGRRLEDDHIRQAAQIAVAHPGPPIKVTWSREEDFLHDFPRPLAIGRGRGAVRDGQVVAFDLDVASSSVTKSQTGRLDRFVPGPDPVIVGGAWDQPYAIPNYRVTGYRAPETIAVSSWRSVGASINGFLHECLLDELIHAAGADPLAERIRLCDHDLSRRVLEAVGELSGWGTPLPPGRGRGVAFTASFGTPCAEVVEVTDTPDGIRLDAVYVVAEVGRVLDPVNFENQVQGGVIWGLGHAMLAELTHADGIVQQTNFHQYPSIRLKQVPRIVVQALEHGDQIRGIGEPPVPPAAPALANAIFAATGRRIRELPLRKHVRFA